MGNGGMILSPTTDSYFENPPPSSIGIAVTTTDPAPQYQPARSVTPSAGMALGRYQYPTAHHGGVGSGPAEWEMGEVQHPVGTGGDLEANWSGNPRHYIKMQSEQSLAHGDLGYDDVKRVQTTTTRKPVRPPRPAEPVLHPLVSFHLLPLKTQLTFARRL